MPDGTLFGLVMGVALEVGGKLIIMGIDGVAAGGAIGAADIAGTAGVVGVAGTAGTAGLCGANAETLLVRNDTLLSRAFNTCDEDCCRPPAAGSISSSQAPHL